jgi:hypothetical protein
MTASTTIRCTKSELAAALKTEFAGAWEAMPQRDYAEFQEHCDGIVRQANNHRGTFLAHDAYLDCDLVIAPDETPAENPHYACDTHGAVCPTGEHTLHTSGHPVAGGVKCETKTMADYRPGTAVRRMLSELSYLGSYNRPIGMRMTVTAVDAECGEQGITEHLSRPLDEIGTWIAEQVHEIRANR